VSGAALHRCLSPALAERLNSTGRHDAVHPRDVGRLREADHVIVRRCIDEDRIIVTVNARDFRALLLHRAIHPGLVILPSVGRDASWSLLAGALDYLENIGRERPEDVMVNHVLEVDFAGIYTLSALP
jgi:predicted nuclease of predicted toxin-antitoxin system